MASISVSPETAALHESCFDKARLALEWVERHPDAVRHILPDEDSAHVTGHHVEDGLSRYNAHRQGFVFSNGQTLSIQGMPEFQHDMQRWFQSLHSMAESVLTELEQAWQLPEKWFQQSLGPTSSSSQWHVKRFTRPDNIDDMNNDLEWLPLHTDPSLISIVIHDAPGKQEGAMGLQVQQSSLDGRKQWRPVPNHGHAVATVLVGSVLSFITGGRTPAAKHRVVYTEQENDMTRLAATLFVRPQGTATLMVPPSPLFQDVFLKKKITFDQWSARVSRNYMKNKKPTSLLSPEKTIIPTDNDAVESGYYRDEWTELSLISSDPPLTGREKYLGGELGHKGKIYTIPGHATRVLVMDTTQEPPTITAIGPCFAGDYKWLRAARMPNGILYGIPCHADCILRIDPETNKVSTIHWKEDEPGAPAKDLPWKWHGGNVAPNNQCLYCIPQFAEYVLKLDPITEQVSFLAQNAPMVGHNKWYGGLVGPSDGAIYGICQNATGVLRIDPTTDLVTIHGDFPEGHYKWHGGVVGPDGCIYGIPAHADRVLKIIPGRAPVVKTIGGPLRTGQHRDDGKYKYLGGALGHDGNVYFFPSDADFVLQVNPSTEETREVGPNLRDYEKIHHNKWQNGFTAPDGAIYGIPLKSTSVLRIRTTKSKEPEVATIGGPYLGLNKWEGGVMTEKGEMFCMPLNHNQVLRMRSVIGDDKA
jgi:isopenicillin N synthase-like dioxygenase